MLSPRHFFDSKVANDCKYDGDFICTAEVALTCTQKKVYFMQKRIFILHFPDKTAFLVHSWVGFEVEIAYALILTEPKQNSHRIGKPTPHKTGIQHGFQAGFQVLNSGQERFQFAACRVMFYPVLNYFPCWTTTYLLAWLKVQTNNCENSSTYFLVYFRSH